MKAKSPARKQTRGSTNHTSRAKTAKYRNQNDNVRRGNAGLKDIYHNTKHPAGYSTPERLWKGVKKKVPKNEVVAYLEGQDSYTLHKRARRTFPRNVTYADNIDDCWQADLADFSDIRDENQENSFILCVIDVFSKFAWTLPVRDKKADTVVEAFKTIFNETDRRPTRIITDKGREFDNRKLKKYLQDMDIQYAHTNNPDTKCSVVERFIGTLRPWLQKVFTERERYEYTGGVLIDITRAYNEKFHKTLKMTPIEASQPDRVLEVYRNLYQEKLGGKKITPKLKVGDYVRISREKKRFEKGCTWNWSEEIYKITQVIKHEKPVYRIADLDNNEELEGTFYSWELSRVTKPDKFKIAYIVKTRGKGDKTQHLVHWRGYPVSSRSWVMSKDIDTS